MIRVPIGIRNALIGSSAAGIALAPFVRPEPAGPALGLVGLLFGLLGAALRRQGAPGSRLPVGCAVACLALWAGLLLGQARLAAIDGGAFRAADGRAAVFRGYLDSPPASNRHGVRLHLSGPMGRVAVLGERPIGALRVGSGLTVTGRVEQPPPYLAGYLKRHGIARVIRATRIESGPPRGGLAGLLDDIRERALAGMGAGMEPGAAALTAGFVLGQDGAIDPVTKEDFRRSGLAHLLAASGQNVMLLVLLATVPLALAGLGLRRRVPVLIAIVLLYLSLTGADPSIQRAAVMGVVMLIVLWRGGAGSRLFALLVAAAATLAANPRAGGDPGWQLSFAATVGIMLLAPDLRWLLLNTGPWRRDRSGTDRGQTPPGSLPAVLADGAAVTIAAGLATAPLVVYHFGALPLTTLSANLLALPAVAPTMWLGMIAGIAGQAPALPTEPINWLNEILVSYIAAVAAAVSDLPGGVVEPSLESGLMAGAGLVGLLAGFGVLLRRLRRASAAGFRRRLFWLGLAACLLIPPAGVLVPAAWLQDSARTPEGLRIVALDVGQGDAILIQARDAGVLVDTGPPGAGIGRLLRRYGIERLAGVFITHGDLDHIGGLPELLDGFEITHLIHARPPAAGPASGPESFDAALAAAEGSPTAVVAGRRLRLGDAEFEVLWPPAAVAASAAEPNSRSLVLLLRWRGFKALFTGDAEAEASAYTSGDIDLLKVAHHGSADEGLPALLAESTPAIALISAGRDNPHGHPHPTTLAALQEAGAEVHRTDLEGDLVVEVP